jgi:endoglucanase
MEEKMTHLFKILTILMGGSLFLTGCLLPPASESAATPKKEEPSLCKALATIDDFEDGNDQIYSIEGRGGYIYTYVDETGSKVSPPENKFMVSKGGVGESKYAVRVKGLLNDADKVEGDIYGGVSLEFSEEGPESPYDASKYKGISFLAKLGDDSSVSEIRFKIPDVNTQPEGGICTECYNDFGINIKLSKEWTRYVILFEDLTQESGWGDPRPKSLNVAALIGLSWEVAASNVKFDFYVDDVSFIGACGELQEFKKAAKAESKPEAVKEPEAKAGDEIKNGEKEEETKETAAKTGDASAKQ